MTTHAFQYVACDIPPDMTIDAWKREKPRTAARRRRWRVRFARRAR